MQHLNILQKYYPTLSNYKHIGYTDDSFVYSFNINDENLVAKFLTKKDCIEIIFYSELCGIPFSYKKWKPLFSNITKYEIPDFIESNIDLSKISKCDFISYPCNIITNKENQYYICIFKKYSSNLTNINMLQHESINKDKWLQIGDDLISGLNYLHNFKYTHNDLKPLNICLDSIGTIKIIDFGLSLKIDDSDNKYDVKNTIFWTSPLQFYLGIKEDFCSNKELRKRCLYMFKDEILKIEHLLYNKYKNLYIDTKGQLFENPVKNDKFGCALLLIYIYANNINFWTEEVWTNKIEDNDLILFFGKYTKNVLEFLENPKNKIKLFLLKYELLIPEKYKDIIEKYLSEILEE